MIPPTIYIEATTLPIAWAKLIKEVLNKGIILPTEYENFSKDVCSITTITHPFEQSMLHPQFPTKEKHLEEYIKQFTREYDWKKQGFKYTYMGRLIEPIDQLEYLKKEMQKPITRRGIARTWIPTIDINNTEPPCWQDVFLRKLTPTTVEMHCHWRSRDLFSAWNSNYIGILTMMKNEIFDPLGLKLVKLVDFVDALHIYQADWEAASKVNLFYTNPQLQ